MKNIELLELSTEELLLIDGGREGDAWEKIGYAIGRVKGAIDNFIDYLEGFFDGLLGK